MCPKFLLFLVLLVTACGLPKPQLSLRGDSSVNQIAEDPDGSLKIFIPYVGQGDATLLLMPSGKTLLIDAGPPGAGRDFLIPLLENLGISALDAMIISHYDLDHLGGVPDLLAGRDDQLGTEDDITVAKVYDRGGIPWDSSPGYSAYLQALEMSQSPRKTLAVAEEIDIDPDVGIRCLAVNGEVWNQGNIQSIDLTPNTYSSKENAASITLLLEFGAFRYLTAGDLTGGGSTDGFLSPDIEGLLADAVGPVDALHVNHHGSTTSSNQAFVDKTSPEAVFIQAGVDNPYGHPRAQVVHNWEAAGAKIYSTEKGRGFRLSLEGGNFSIEESDL